MVKRALVPRLLVTIVSVAVLGVGALSARADAPLRTAVVALGYGAGEGDLAFSRTADSGATVVRLDLLWAAVAPTAPTNPTDPADPAYQWSSYDAEVTLAAAHGLEVIAELDSTPSWALNPATAGATPTLPDPVALGKFAQAAAARYSGTVPGPPRVRYWEAWNEPNISLSLQPQFVAGAPITPDWYRQMVNAVAAGVKAVHADNLVIAGGTAPFYDNTPAVTAIDPDWGPLSFMRALLCLGSDLKATCSAPVHFDIWAHHPYTSGGPWRSAVRPNDVSLGDLPEMRTVLDAGVATGHVVSDIPVRFWVTEFSWDSDPPDPQGVPEPLLTRWTAEALYTMWQSGVSLVTWFTLRDYPFPSIPYQAGLYYRGSTLALDTPKPHLQAFRFPFVAYAHRSQLEVWGRTPGGKPADVIVEQSAVPGWNILGTVRADSDGIFMARFQRSPVGTVRARSIELGAVSAPFSLDVPRDQTFTPFGGPPLEPEPTTARPILPHGGSTNSARRIALETQLRNTGSSP
jgi:hypothetical protein